MASTPEGKVKVKVKLLLNKHDTYHFWPVQTGLGSRTLDCLGCHKGDMFAVETKAPGQHPTELQELIISEIERSGGVVFVIGERATDDVYKYSGMEDLSRWLNRSK